MACLSFFSLFSLSLLVLLSILLVSLNVVADEHDHLYDDGEEVVLWMNTVGPYHNRQETYTYYTLPFCRGPKKAIQHHHENLGEALQGVELEFSGLDIQFKENTGVTEYCSIVLNEKNYKIFSYAVKHHYWYQMYLDDLPMWALVGDFGDEGADPNHEKAHNGGDLYLWTHKKFDIGVNGRQIVDVNVTTAKRVKIEVGATVHFTYQVNWKTSSIQYSCRFDKYLDHTFFQHKIHWFSIFNSFMMVIFLVGLVAMILIRTLRKDYARYSKMDEFEDLESDLGDEYGWKQVHGDVFRAAEQPLFFSALIATGSHLAASAFVVLLFVIGGEMYTQSGQLLTTAIAVYALMAPVAGFVGGSLYAQQGGKEWIKQVVATATLFPCFVSTIVFLINFIAIYYHASRAIPITTMALIVGIWLGAMLPLTLVGAIVGKNMRGVADVPCRVNPVPRPIPEKVWFVEPSVIVLLGGVLPFGSIFIEMYFIFTSFWAYKIYYVYGFMLLVFVILSIVTVCVTIVCCYFLLNSEDYRWKWTSFLAAASTAIYVYLYAVYFYFFKTRMFGAFQTTFYFGYSAILAVALGIMCGFFGYTGATFFVHRIYRNVKID